MRRLLYLTVLSMLVVALTASVALGQSRGPSGADGSFNCEDFDTQASAQRYFEANNPQQDPDGLDGAIGFDSTGTPGVACENLPGPKNLTPAPGYGSTTVQPTTTMNTTPPPPVAQNNLACAELGDTGEQAQQQAQAILNQNPSDPNGLDADGDGIPCEFTESSGQITYEDDSTIFITTAPQQPQQPQQMNGQQAGQQQMQNLPDTGGFPLSGIAAGAGALLVAGGLLLKRRVT